jgi:ribosomal protein S18 acetylase RimI-like enzyme
MDSRAVQGDSGQATLGLSSAFAAGVSLPTTRRPTQAHLQEVSRIHCEVLPDGFLARLGPAVLYEIYAGAASSPNAIWLVRRYSAGIAGFLLATVDMGALFRHILLRRGPRLVPLLLRAASRESRLIARMLESLRYPRTRAGEPGGRPGGAELVAIGVRPEYRSNGYATAMILGLNAAFPGRGVSYYTVSVYASNAVANAFYRKLGFEVGHEFRMYGAAWISYRLDLSPAVSAARTIPGSAPAAAGPPRSR